MKRPCFTNSASSATDTVDAAASRMNWSMTMQDVGTPRCAIRSTQSIARNGREKVATPAASHVR